VVNSKFISYKVLEVRDLTIFSFKRESRVYVVFGGKQFNIDISSIDFSQTYEEFSYSNKTIQIPNMFEQAVINKANPANFNLTFPAIRESDLHILFNRALDYKTFDLYVENGPNIFKLEKCVITTLGFNMSRDKPLSLSVQGEAIELSLVESIPGTVVNRSANRTYNRLEVTEVLLGGKPSTNISGISIELSTEVNWTSYTTTNKAIEALSTNRAMYPSDFTVKKRSLSGSFSNYYPEDINWGLNTSLIIQAGEKIGSTIYGFEFNIDEVAFVTGLTTGQIFGQQYNWTMTQNPYFLGQVIRLIGYANILQAIQDSWDIDILDSNNDTLLESL